MKKYLINEIFYSMQGEGVRTGTANFFLRFTGCNLTCKMETHGFDCDTEFVSGQKMTAAEIFDFMMSLNNKCRWVICTGGEPALQLDKDLVDFFHDKDMKVAIETNGSINVDHLDLDWITVSPKVAEHAIKQLTCHEVKYVRNLSQTIPKTAVLADHYLISPAFNGLCVDKETVEHCIQLCKDNPMWRLSIQQHKFLGIP